MENLNCCERKCNIWCSTIIMGLISVLLLWNIVLTITVTDSSSNDNTNSDCFCVEQMRNTLEQIVRLYPDNQLLITLEGGDAVIGTPGEIRLGPNGKSGIFELVTSQEDTTQYVSICSIDSITINNATYNDQITYLPEPEPLPTDCKIDCENAIREVIPVGTPGVSIISNTQISSTGDVVANVPGMVVLEDTNRNTISFVSSCRIDVVYLPDQV